MHRHNRLSCHADGGAGEEPPNDDAIVKQIVYPHPIARVWQALTDPETLAAWLMRNDFEPRLGHRFRLHDVPQEGWRGYVECEVVAIEPPARLSYTWDGGSGPPTLVTFTLEAVPDGTRLRLEHSGFAAGGERGKTIRDILDAGWGTRLLRARLPAVLERLASGSTPSRPT